MAVETLLDKAIYNYAVLGWNAMSDDEAYLNLISYNLQQSVELAIKHILTKEGVEYTKTHDIEQLLRIARENSINVCAGEYIEEHAEMFSSWEAKTRYILGYRVEYHKVETAISEVGKYLETLKELESGKDPEPEKDTESENDTGSEKKPEPEKKLELEKEDQTDIQSDEQKANSLKQGE